MCIGKDLFLNRRTRQSGYIGGKMGESLTLTQKRDLVQVIDWVECKYKFEPEDIADFLGIPVNLVITCLAEANPNCKTCSKTEKDHVVMKEKDHLVMKEKNHMVIAATSS